MRQLVAVTCLALVLILIIEIPAASAQGCEIQLKADPKVVHFPYDLPPPNAAATFGELLDANYSTSLSGQTIVVQYQNASRWLYLLNFSANPVGFTVTPAGLNSGWTRTGLNALRAISGSCVSATESFTVQVDRSAIYSDIVVYIVIAIGAVAFFLVGRWARFVLFLGVAAAVYLALAPFTGQRYDVYFLASSGIRILQHVNPFDPGNPPIYPPALKWAYPPIYAAFSALSFLVYQVITGASLPSVPSLTWPGYASLTYDVWEAFVPKFLPILVLLLKLPMVVSAFATGLLLQRITGSKSAAISWLANPLVILVAAVWGQLDPIATLLALSSVYFYGKNKPYQAYFLASLGAAVKVWPFILVPLFLASSLKRGGLKAIKPATAVLPALAASVGLYALFGNLPETLFVFLYARGIPTYAGQFAVNGLTWQQILFVLGSPPVPLFLILGIPLYAFILVHIYRTGDIDIAKWVIVSILIFYLTYNYVNPQYFYWMLPFLIIQGRKLATWLFTILPMAFVGLAYNIFYFVSPTILYDEFSIAQSIVEQLKLAYFYTSLGQYLVLTALIPTLVYLVLLRQELKRTSNAKVPWSSRSTREGEVI